RRGVPRRRRRRRRARRVRGRRGTADDRPAPHGRGELVPRQGPRRAPAAGSARVNEFLRRADETPVTLLVALAYITLAFLTDPFHPTSAQLVHYGALRGVDAADGEPWRLLTHAFLHGGLLHLAVNTISLLNIGPLLERSIGPVRFAVVYVITAI